MQNTMNSTITNPLQDDSSVEYTDARENPVSTIPNDAVSVSDMTQTSLFDFHAVHNGESCIASLDPKDRGTERQFRFTRALLCTLLGVKSDNTISNHIEALIKRGVIEVVKNLTTLKIPTNGGMQETVLYDLKVFNYLVMRLDTDQAWEKKAIRTPHPNRHFFISEKVAIRTPHPNRQWSSRWVLNDVSSTAL